MIKRLRITMLAMIVLAVLMALCIPSKTQVYAKTKSNYFLPKKIITTHYDNGGNWKTEKYEYIYNKHNRIKKSIYKSYYNNSLDHKNVEKHKYNKGKLKKEIIYYYRDGKYTYTLHSYYNSKGFRIRTTDPQSKTVFKPARNFFLKCNGNFIKYKYRLKGSIVRKCVGYGLNSVQKYEKFNTRWFNTRGLVKKKSDYLYGDIFVYKYSYKNGLVNSVSTYYNGKFCSNTQFEYTKIKTSRDRYNVIVNTHVDSKIDENESCYNYGL